MKKTKKNLRTVLSNTSLGLIAMGVFSTLSASFADYPQWWLDQGVVNTNAVATNDYAAVNQGQLKHMAAAAYGDIASRYPSLNTSSLSNLVSGFSNSDNYAAVNLGQLKYVSMQFYDFLWANNLTNAWPAEMLSGPYPWSSSSTTNANDYALANLGQLKCLFSFDFENAAMSIDSDGDGLPDEWEMENFGNLLQNAAGDHDGDGISNLQEYLGGTNPAVDVDGDGSPDWEEALLATNPQDYFD